MLRITKRTVNSLKPRAREYVRQAGKGTISQLTKHLLEEYVGLRALVDKIHVARKKIPAQACPDLKK